jgi:WD40 repeat protein
LFRLSKTRRKRPVPEGWATAEAISAYKPTESTDALYPGGKVLSVNASGDSVLVETAEGTVGVFSLSQKKIIHTLQTDGHVTNVLWAGEKAVVASSTGSVKVFESGKEIANFNSHAGAATGLALHATGDIVASVGEDKSYALYDLTTNGVILQNFSNACECFSGGKKPSKTPGLQLIVLSFQPCSRRSSTQTATFSLLVVPMVKLRFMTSKQEPWPQLTTLPVL